MKTIKYILASLTLGLFLFSACTKEETVKYDIPVTSTGGQVMVQGSVKYLDYGTSTSPVAAPFATIKISNDLTTKTFTQFWQADSVGNFAVKGLAVGNYYIAAEYQDAWGYTYTTNGYTVNVKNTVNPITLDFICK
jgi:hypothetical protein